MKTDAFTYARTLIRCPRELDEAMEARIRYEHEEQMSEFKEMYAMREEGLEEDEYFSLLES